jgi:uncharacterized protein (DUF934 family)
MLPLLRRCGFDAAQLVAGQSLEAARRSLGFFPGHYQRDVLQNARPLSDSGSVADAPQRSAWA